MTIASALDKLNDKLAGSDQQASQTIEGMILRIIDNIDQGGGGSIPVASADTLGGIKVGENLSITDGGVLSASGGGGGGGLIVHPSYEDGFITLDKTWKQIYDALAAGGMVCVVEEVELEGFANVSLVVQANHQGDIYSIYVTNLNGTNVEYIANGENGYPSVEED